MDFCQRSVIEIENGRKGQFFRHDDISSGELSGKPYNNLFSRDAMKIFCDRIREEVNVERKPGQVVVECRYFKMIPKGPACKRVLFGRLGFPIPTPMSMVKTVRRMVNMAFLDFMKVSLGTGARITWHCPHYFEEPPEKGPMDAMIEPTLSVIDTAIDTTEIIDHFKKLVSSRRIDHEEKRAEQGGQARPPEDGGGLPPAFGTKRH